MTEKMLGSLTRRALTTARVSERHHDRAVNCAHYLDRSGWLRRQALICGNVHAGASREVSLKYSAKLAFQDLQAVGIIPSGFIISMVWRLILMPFLTELIKDWVWGSEETVEPA